MRARARRAEALGRLEEATALYVEAGAPAEAARLYALRAESTEDPLERLQLLGQAARVAPVGQSARSAAPANEPADDARSYQQRHARLALELVRSGRLRYGATELTRLGDQLSALGEPLLAADVYATVGDVDAQAEALSSVGALDRLESLLEADLNRERCRLELDAFYRTLCDLDLGGRRREALLKAAGGAQDARTRELVERVAGRRVRGPILRAELAGEYYELALGARVLVGRTEAAINVSSPLLSREHLEISASSSGPVLRDLESRNGTWIRGARLDGPIPVGDGVAVELGGASEVSVAVRPAPYLGPQAVCITAGGHRVHAPLGALTIGSLRVELGDDGWVEVHADGGNSFVLGKLLVAPPIQLALGDELRLSARDPVLLRVLE